MLVHEFLLSLSVMFGLTILAATAEGIFSFNPKVKYVLPLIIPAYFFVKYEITHTTPVTCKPANSLILMLFLIHLFAVLFTVIFSIFYICEYYYNDGYVDDIVFGDSILYPVFAFFAGTVMLFSLMYGLATIY